MKTNRDKLKEVFRVNLDDKDGEYYLSYCYQALDATSLEFRKPYINTPINDWLDAEYKGDDKSNDGLDEVIKCLSDTNKDLLGYIKVLEEDNKKLRKENEQLMEQYK